MHSINDNATSSTPPPRVNSRINCVTATDDIFTAHQPDATQISETFLPTDGDMSDVEPLSSAISLSNVTVKLNGRVLERPPLPSPKPRANRSATPVRVAHDPLHRERRRRSESASPVQLRREQQAAPATRPGHLVEDFEDLVGERRLLNVSRRPLFDGDSMRTVSVLGRLGFPRVVRLRRLNVGFMRPPVVNNNVVDDENPTRQTDDAPNRIPSPPPLPRFLQHPLNPQAMMEENAPFFPFGGLNIAGIRNYDEADINGTDNNAATTGANNINNNSNNDGANNEADDGNWLFSIRRMNEHCIIL